jgi:hypothetical protein
LWLVFLYILLKGGYGFGGIMNHKKANVHFRKLMAVSVKKQLKGNDTWGREFMSFCLQNVDDKTLELVSDNMVLDRGLMEQV